MSDKVFILLPVHNRKEITARFINCLNSQTFRNYHLILIDDGSKDGTEMMVKEEIKNLIVLKGSGDLWWAGSLNIGIEWLHNAEVSDNDLVLIINNDVLIEPDFLGTAVNILSSMNETLLLAQIRNPEKDNVEETGIHADLAKLSFEIASIPEKINCLSTRGLFMRWKDMKKIGYFRSKLLPHYTTDYEYTIRAKRMGFNLITVPSLYLISSPEITGIRQLSGDSCLTCLKELFDRRYIMNPVYWTNFVILTSPIRWMLLNIIRAWGRALIKVLICMKRAIE